MYHSRQKEMSTAALSGGSDCREPPPPGEGVGSLQRQYEAMGDCALRA